METKGRLASIDLLRGLVIVLMALDHTRGAWPGVQSGRLHAASGMLFLAGLAWLPLPAVAAIAAQLILPHNLLDAVQSLFPAALWLDSSNAI